MPVSPQMTLQSLLDRARQRGRRGLNYAQLEGNDTPLDSPWSGDGQPSQFHPGARSLPGTFGSSGWRDIAGVGANAREAASARGATQNIQYPNATMPSSPGSQAIPQGASPGGFYGARAPGSPPSNSELTGSVITGANGGQPTYTNSDQGNNGGGDNGDGLGSQRTFDGFAGSLPALSWDDVMADPDMMAYEWLKYMNGEDPSSAMADRFSGAADIAPMLRLLMDPNATGSANDESDAQMLNWISQYMEQQAQAGGGVPDLDNLLNNLVEAGGMDLTGTGNENKNQLAELLSGGTDTDQIKNYASYAAAATQGLNEQSQMAVLNRLERWAREWKSAKNADPQNYKITFGQYVQSKGGLFGAG